MSKKKVTGNTMTLKDFHGGSIPSDLPLPSAPGTTIRPSDRSPYDRSVSWSNSQMGLADHKSRQHSLPITRKLEDKAPFFASTMQIGRNFDEDERKPLDGGPTPRRTISDESYQIGNTRAESKPTYGVTGGQELAPVTKFSSDVAPNSSLGRAFEASIVNPQNLGNSGLESGVYQNAWAARKERMSGVTESVPSVLIGGAAVSKLSQASALEKVSSGRWQSKQSLNHPGDISVRFSESHGNQKVEGYGNISYKSFTALSERENEDYSLATFAEKGIGLDDGIKGVQETAFAEKVVAQKYVVARERKSEIEAYEVQQSHNDRRLGKYELQQCMPSEPSERPKLKLLPRTKPLESLEPIITNYTQVAGDTYSTEAFEEDHGNTTPVKPSLSIVENAKLEVERPKLNLKPRSQIAEQFEEFTERDRSSLFGGARPRELVLKNRGVDDILANNSDIIQNSDRVEHDVTKTEKFQGQRVPTHYTGKRAEADVDRVDSRKRNGGHERQQQKQQLDRPPSPETWRKPIEEPKLASTDEGLRYGKVASATELAQTFSKSVSDPKISDCQPGQRNLPGMNQVRFSRLTGPSPSPSPSRQINGY